MLKPLNYVSNKKLKTARIVYEQYCKLHSLAAVKAETGLAINTIRKYIALAEDVNKRNKISTKDRYYNDDTAAAVPEVIPSPGPPIYNIYNKENINIENINKEYKENNNINNNSEDNIYIEDNNNDIDIITIKDKLILNKLNNISNKYLDYLNNIDLYSMDKVSIKDIGIIAGISLDKAAQLKHKDVVKTNQSIIFNLFGNNKSLTEFIAGSIGRQERLSSRPVKKYTPALNK